MKKQLLPLIERLVDAVERMAPRKVEYADIQGAEAFIWNAEEKILRPVWHVHRVDMELLRGIELVADLLYNNTKQFASGLPANNALLWGARGMGKSSLVKAVHARVNQEVERKLALIEIAREDISSLPDLLTILRKTDRRFILFCDDLSFEPHEISYKTLKSVLEGGVEAKPDNVIFYATSNRRHLLAREATENEAGSALHPGEVVHEKLSLSDRFGLWLGFHQCSEAMYQDMVAHYAKTYGLTISTKELQAAANEWSRTRGARSGRVAWQFIQDLAGKMGKHISQN